VENEKYKKNDDGEKEWVNILEEDKTCVKEMDEQKEGR
jgi:hypothetical protein